jgi:hypothetical protein
MSTFCQSCSMPLEKKEQLGTEKNGSVTNEYCVYCYENGEFLQPDITMEEMIVHCVGYMTEEGMDENEARNLFEHALPNIKRWQ